MDKIKKKECKVIVKSENCKGCYLCVEFCKPGALKVSKNLNKMGYYYVEPNEEKSCNGCTACAIVCPDLVIEVYGE
ncbi:MAG: 4Fe-4S dicluster domain-containing protein [Desulfobacterales bacterium]|nr:4Fe-4S dicluster domain-containing protein [Desulfobacterales bacterium]MBF0398009.1 4Fe-4S dicluster domain-containing protein [Desulfobacterales bacterium]